MPILRIVGIRKVVCSWGRDWRDNQRHLLGGILMTIQTINVTVSSVIFTKQSDNGPDWFILETDQGQATGEMAWEPAPGEQLVLSGFIGEYQGREQFQFKGARPNVPEDPEALLRYVCSRALGVGEAMCEAIWQAHGVDWQAKLAPGCVPKLGDKTYASLCTALTEAETEKTRAESIGWLLAHGATDSIANKAFSSWGIETVPRVNSDPYQLCDLERVGFDVVDNRIASKLGIIGADPRRVAAGVLYAVKRSNESGHTLLTWDAVKREAAALLTACSLSDLIAGVKKLLEDEKLHAFPEVHCLSLRRHYDAASVIAEAVQ